MIAITDALKGFKYIQASFERMKYFLLFAAFLFTFSAGAQESSDRDKILQILDDQTRYWNQGDLENFMQGYWKNDSLMFIGKSGITYGWQKTLDNYKKGYPDTTAMGRLRFNIITVKELSPDTYFVVGQWFLGRTIGNLNGHFTLVFRKIDGAWKIVADHSS